MLYGEVAESGRSRRTRNAVWGNTHRGFESHPLRRIHGDQLVSRFFFREESINSLQTGRVRPNSIIGSPEYPGRILVYLEGR